MQIASLKAFLLSPLGNVLTRKDLCRSGRPWPRGGDLRGALPGERRSADRWWWAAALGSSPPCLSLRFLSPGMGSRGKGLPGTLAEPLVSFQLWSLRPAQPPPPLPTSCLRPSFGVTLNLSLCLCLSLPLSNITSTCQHIPSATFLFTQNPLVSPPRVKSPASLAWITAVDSSCLLTV